MPKPQLNTIKPLCKRADIKHSLHGVCETFPIHRARLLKRITWKKWLIFQKPHMNPHLFTHSPNPLLHHLSHWDQSRAGAWLSGQGDCRWRDWARGDGWVGKRERGRQAIKKKQQERNWDKGRETVNDGSGKWARRTKQNSAPSLSVCGREIERGSRDVESRADRGRKEREPCSHYSSWVTSHHSHNSRSWHVTSTIIWSKFAQPGRHTWEGEGAGQRVRRKKRSRANSRRWIQSR